MHLVQDQVDKGAEHDADEEDPPLDGAEDPADDKGCQGGRHDAEEGDDDDHIGAVARLVAFFDPSYRSPPLRFGQGRLFPSAAGNAYLGDIRCDQSAFSLFSLALYRYALVLSIAKSQKVRKVFHRAKRNKIKSHKPLDKSHFR